MSHAISNGVRIFAASVALLSAAVGNTKPKLTNDFLMQRVKSTYQANPKTRLSEFLKKEVVPYTNDAIYFSESHSAQYGYADKPRVLLLSPDRRLAVGFNGSPDSVGGDELEIMEVEGDQTTKFKFLEIVFPAENPYAPSEIKTVTAFDQGDGPGRCLACHSFRLSDQGTAIIPNDGPGLTGVYGGRGLPWSQEDRTNWGLFTSNLASNDRYALLASYLKNQTEKSITERAEKYFEQVKIWISRLPQGR